MTIHIDDTRTIAQLQEDFQKVFPLLKLEFFQKPHSAGGGSEKSEMLPADSTLRSLWRSVHDAGDIIITPQMTVAEVEKEFNAKFGLHVQVFRLSGRAWLQTTFTDLWTLKEQSSVAEYLQQNVE